MRVNRWRGMPHVKRLSLKGCQLLRKDKTMTIVEFLDEHGYASLDHLHQLFAAYCGNIGIDVFKQKLDEMCGMEKPQVASVSAADAKCACLSSNVYYSIAWKKKQRILAEVRLGEIIGLDLYRLIIDKHWNWYTRSDDADKIAYLGYAPSHGFGYLNFASLEDAGYGKVMHYVNGTFYKWMDFARHYSELEKKLKKATNAHRHRPGPMTAEELVRELYGEAVDDINDLNLFAEKDPDPELVDMTFEQKLAAKVGRLGLSTRADDCLVNAGIEKIGELIGKTKEDMRHYRNFGMKSINEIEAQLGKIGLSFKNQ